MAYSKQPTTSHDDTTSLTECGICLMEMENPKALPCLHSFCLNCLKKVTHPPGIFFCPLCREKTTLPPGGVSGFRDNFFINQLKDRQAISTKGKIKKTCVSCRAEGCEIVALCVDCNGFICQQCVKLHQTITSMKVHSVFTIDELQSGNIDMSKVMKEEKCQQHQDQVPRWFCKTCNIPICRDCTVMEQVRPDHDYITIESVNEAQVKEIKSLMASCKSVAQQLTSTIANTEEVELNLTKYVDDIKKQLGEERKAYLDAIERNYKEKMDKLSQIEEEKTEKINIAKRDLHNKISKLDNAVQLADQIITSGSKHDLASNYSTLSTTLADLQEIKVAGVRKEFSEIIFRPRNKDEITRLDLGSISAKGPNPNGNGKWVLKKEIGRTGPSKIKYGLGVAVNSSKDVYIADYSDENVKIFESNGKFKRVLEGNLKSPHGVAVSPDGTHQYVTDRTELVHVFNSQGEKVKQFPALSPDGTASDTDGSRLYGLAVDTDGNILVGSNNMYISKHKPDGSHISSFRTNIHPWLMTVTCQGRIIVCSNYTKQNAEILDHNGKLLHTINKPPDATYWSPTSCCCSDDGIVYVTSNGIIDGGIYSFTEDGTYLGCVTTDVIDVHGIALIDDDRLVVVQSGYPAKMFTYE